MGLPEIYIEFRSRAHARIARGLFGSVCLVLQEESELLTGVHYLYDYGDTPETLSDKNKEQVLMAFYGNDRPPQEVILVIEKPTPNPDTQKMEFKVTGNPTITTLENLTFDFLAIPFIEPENHLEVATWAKSFNEAPYYDTRFMYVGANVEGNHRQVINTTTPEHYRGDTQAWTTEQYVGRIAGLCAGTSMRNSTTKALLPDLDRVTEFTRRELNDKIDAGEFVLMNTRYRGQDQVRTGRGVTSLTETTEDIGDPFKKIKINAITNIQYRDLYRAIEQGYQGRYTNSYANKLVLIGAIYAYIEAYELDGVCERGETTVEINVEKQRNYLKSIGYTMNDGRKVHEMSEEEIKKANTGSHVFIKIQERILDSMEDFDIVAEV